MKYFFLIGVVLAGVAFVNAAMADNKPCKVNGTGYYGRSSVYDVGNPSVSDNCWQERK